MYSDRENPSEARPRHSPDEVRRLVVEAASGTRLPVHPIDQPHLDVYLSLLQDRLPVYVRVMSEILGSPGQDCVRSTLSRIARFAPCQPLPTCLGNTS